MKAKENEGKKLFIIFILLVVTYSIIIGPVSALPADPGHGAPSIGPGTFETGFYVFPNNLSVTENFSVDTNVLFVDSVLNGIGIGTTSPAAKLDIRRSGTTIGDTIYLGNIDWGIFGALGIGVNPSRIYISQSVGSEQLVITNAGNVGINTTTPQNTLNVIGDGNFTGNLYGGTVYSGGSAVLTSYTETDPLWSGNMSNVAFTNIDETFDENLVVTKNFTVDTDTLFVDSALNRIGIGNNTPITKLAISSPSDQLGIIDSDGGQEWRLSANSNMLYIEDENTGAIPFKIEDGADTDTLIIDDAGNVGIGTTGPSAPLHIDASTTAEALVINSSSTDTVHISINSTSSIREFEIGVTGSAHSWGSDKFFIRDETAGQGRLVIDSSGNVGINTTTPQNTLNVIGDINFTGLIYGNGSQLTDVMGTPADTEGAVQFYDDGSFGGNASLFFFNKTTGRIGLGTTEPRSLLEIREDFRGTTGIGFGGEYADIWWDSHDNYGFWFTNRVNNTGAHTIFRFDSDVTDVENMELKANGSVMMYHNLAVGVVDSKLSNAKLLIEGTDFISTFYADYRPDEDIFLTPGKATGNIYIPRGSLILTDGTTGSSAKFAIEANVSDNYMMMITSDGGSEGDILTINSTGYIGIGDSGPDAKLEVLADSGPQLMLTHTDNTDYANFTVDSDGNLTISSSSGNVIIKLG